jgi:hypothetical protein
MNKKYLILLSFVGCLFIGSLGSCAISTTPVPTSTPTVFEPPLDNPAPAPQKLIKKPI